MKNEKLLIDIMTGNELADPANSDEHNRVYARRILREIRPIIEKQVRQCYKDYIVIWLDDIFLCEFYNEVERDELCHSMWRALKEGD